MSDLDQRLADILGRVLHVTSISQVWASAKEFAERLGYTHMAGADASRLAGGAADATFYTDAPRVPAEIDRVYPFRSAPFIQRMLASPVPFLMSELRGDPKHAGPWRELLADAVKRGDGLVVPVYERDEPLAGFVFGGEKPDTSALARAMLHVVAHAAFSRYRTLSTDRPAGARHALSVREIQCLRSLASGKTDGGTAADLGISARTVRFHIDGAKTKLQVASRLQAVAKALQEKIIAV